MPKIFLPRKTVKPALNITAMKPVSPKYPKPKILLLDIPNDASEALSKLGFNVSVGTLGHPYKVKKESGFQPLIGDWIAPNYMEQEIIVIDLSIKSFENGPNGEKDSPDEELDLWGKCDKGFLDPRIRGTIALRKAFDRIYSEGGLFLIFADKKAELNVQSARINRFLNNLYDVQPLSIDVWCLLSEIEDMQVQTDYGTEMQIAQNDSPLASLLGQYLGDGEFTCSLAGGWRRDDDWRTLATNKHGGAVALSRCRQNKGSVIVVPQIKNKADFILQLFTSTLPEIVPHLFPYIESGKWTHLPEYELPIVKALIAKQVEIQEKAKTEVATLQNQISEERKFNGWMHDLLTGTDAQLVEAVKVALAKLDFKKVVDVDAERDKEAKSRREDLQVHDIAPVLVVDIKGLGGHPSDDDASQSYKHTMLRIQEWKRFDVQALTIINHQRHLPPLDRDNKMPFRQEILNYASEAKIGLITAWDLYRFVLNTMKWGWKSEHTKPIFTRSGRIDPIPNHYTFIGHVAHVWTGAVSIKTENMGMQIGDKIAFELDIEFVEQAVTSLEIDRVPVQNAGVGNTVGTETKITRPHMREGMRVFLVCP